MKDLETIIKLSDDESDKFSEFIKNNRKILISSPKDTAKKATELHKNYIETLVDTGKNY